MYEKKKYIYRYIFCSMNHLPVCWIYYYFETFFGMIAIHVSASDSDFSQLSANDGDADASQHQRQILRWIDVHFQIGIFTRTNYSIDHINLSCVEWQIRASLLKTNWLFGANELTSNAICIFSYWTLILVAASNKKKTDKSQWMNTLYYFGVFPFQCLLVRIGQSSYC